VILTVVTRMKAREGDLIETLDGNIFDVKGLVHPPGKIVAFIRFTPDPKGERKRRGVAYRKVYPLQERYSLLREKFPQYLVFDPMLNEQMCEVPVSLVKLHYKPVNGLRQLRSKQDLDEVERQALRFVELLKENAGVSRSKLGISGSLLVRLHTRASDIDPIVYGSENCRKVYKVLKSLMRSPNSAVKPYGQSELKSLFDFRSKDTVVSFEDFVRTESRKVLQGTFQGRDYFVRCVKDWKEVEEKYGAVRYEPVGYAKIRARVVDDSEMIFTPCHYRIDNVETLEGTRVDSVHEIVSFRGRFCEQATKGEAVVAQGKVEKVQELRGRESYRLVLGNRISDFMVPVDTGTQSLSTAEWTSKQQRNSTKNHALWCTK